MKLLDILLSLTIPSLILLHLLVAPYTKVEESFNIQATHDILVFNTPTNDIYNRLSANFDHFSFPGAVPRTFVGAAALAGLTRPVFTFVSFKHAQVVVRGLLGLFNAAALLKYRNSLERSFGSGVARWYILLQASQFHVIFYASRTLPNMFAFGLTTLAFREFLPIPSGVENAMMEKRQRMAIYLFVLAGVVFRAEVALLLLSQLGYSLLFAHTSFRQIVKAGIISALVALGMSVPIDSYFWQRPIWPELFGFYYNAIQGKSAEWGTSPWYYYFAIALPKLLMNPLIPLVLGPFAYTLKSFRFHSDRRVAMSLAAPSLLYIMIYSLQPHKEARFIIYVVPPLTACAALAASRIWSLRTKSLLYSLGSLILVGSVLLSLVASTAMLGISSLNYPGGVALSKLHEIIEKEPGTARLSVHMDVLSCMTGITRFQQYRPDRVTYDKTEDDATLLYPEFWQKFDYVLAESPEKVIGKWDIVETIYAYQGIEILKPSSVEVDLYDAVNATKVEDGEEKVLESEDVQGQNIAVDNVDALKRLKKRVRNLTGGWWVGPKMGPAIYILKRQRDGLKGQESVEYIR
ncbi:Alg9-like mannosyltransferase [Phlyctema vagabunda]|uniref:Mannosyltransferase n=1 Tax=Phlyctema vagabunda TaxID=108571 RepID=A0ABR4P781_9HELO